MSICSNSLRALSRSRNSPSKTLLPFLYQTATIQQWKPVARPAARRAINTRRPNRGDDAPFKEDIPFEDETLPPSLDQEPARKTTITGSERAAFQKLYKKFSAEGQTEGEKHHDVELDQIADEYYEDDEQSSQPSLDDIFDEVLKGVPSRAAHLSAQSQKGSTRTGQAQPAEGFTEKTKLEQTNSDAEMIAFRRKRVAEKMRIDELIQSAPTDRALWQILDREVFEKVRELDLDGTKTPPNAPQSKTKPDPPTSDARMLFQNYPHHLITAIHTLRREFPSSPLPLSILPAVKALGRSSHALGATTNFYRHLISCAWIQQSSYSYIDTLLTEMNNGAIEFDSSILALLDTIIREHYMANEGSFGRGVQMVYGMEMFLEGIRKIKEWRVFIAERLGVASQERRASEKIVRRIQPGKEGLWRGVGSEVRRVRVQNSTDRNTGTRSSPNYIPLVEGASSMTTKDGRENAAITAEGNHTVPSRGANQEAVDHPSDGLKQPDAIDRTENPVKVVL